MKKIILSIVINLILSLFLITAVYAAPNTVSFGTIGTGATAIPIGSEIELYTPDGSVGSGYIRLNIPDGIALSAISTLSYAAKVTVPGTGGYAPEVVLNIDADGVSGLEGTGIDWMLSSYNPITLNGDNFLSGDENPPTKGIADLSFFSRDVKSGYSYWAADDVRTGFGSFYDTFANVISSILPAHDIDTADKVYSVDIVIGTSGNFNGMRTLFQNIELNGVTYPVITPTPTPDPFAIPAECSSIEFSGAPIIGTGIGEVINGTNGNDLIFALGGGDKVDGKNGNDCIVGGAGGDLLIGGNGSDVILGGNGGDSLKGGNGSDKLFGENGSDLLQGENANDTLDGGLGSDAANGGSGGNDACTAEYETQCEI